MSATKGHPVPERPVLHPFCFIRLAFHAMFLGFLIVTMRYTARFERWLSI